jgi:hypothetical protein
MSNEERSGLVATILLDRLGTPDDLGKAAVPQARRNFDTRQEVERS